MNKSCCGFGHRNLYKNIDDKLDEIIGELISVHGVRIFMTGNMGDFDKSFSASVRRAKKRYENISLILIIPYLTKELNVNKEYYEENFDEIILPEELSGVHYKSAITKRNRWMIDNSEYVLTYVYRSFGGAYDAMKYAEKSGKFYVNIKNE